jgi:D-xylose transport system substrate-binding protein
MSLRITVFCCLLLPFLAGWGHLGPKVKVGLALDHLEGREPWVKSLGEELDESRAQLLTQDAKDNPASQTGQVEDLIREGIQALVVLPCDPLKAAPLVDAAHRAGIKVISVDRPIPDSDLDYLITFNSEKAGELQAKALVRLVPKGRYVLLGADSTDSDSKELRAGQMKVLQPLIDRGDIRIAASQWARPSEVEVKTKALLAREQNRVDAVLASDSTIAERALRALEEAKLADKVPVTGRGDDLQTCRRILSGSQTMTVYSPPQKLAEETAYLAAKLARKATEFDCQFVEVESGRQKVKAVLLTPLAVDAKNLDSTVIKDGVQKKEEVYGK